MTLELKVRKFGNSLGIVLPKEALNHLRVEEGDVLTVTEGAESSLRVTPHNSEFAKTMEVFASLNKRYRNTLLELAK